MFGVVFVPDQHVARNTIIAYSGLHKQVPTMALLVMPESTTSPLLSRAEADFDLDKRSPVIRIRNGPSHDCKVCSSRAQHVLPHRSFRSVCLPAPHHLWYGAPAEPTSIRLHAAVLLAMAPVLLLHCLGSKLYPGLFSPPLLAPWSAIFRRILEDASEGLGSKATQQCAKSESLCAFAMLYIGFFIVLDGAHKIVECRRMGNPLAMSGG